MQTYRVFLQTKPGGCRAEEGPRTLCFDPRACGSHQFDAPKENPDFWPKLEQHLKFDKQRTVFIDDTESVLKSAEHYGIRFNLAIAQPDSELPAKQLADFVTLNEFQEIMH